MLRKLKIPYTGKKIHFEPTSIMEFKDSQGVLGPETIVEGGVEYNRH